MIILAYILLVPCSYIFFSWFFVHCAVIGGHKIDLPEGTKYAFPFAIPITIWCLHTILTQ